jgi:hypothetical protein
MSTHQPHLATPVALQWIPLILAALCAAPLGADEKVTVSTGSDSVAASAPENVKRLVAELSSSDYRTREDATKQLAKAGSEAVAAVGKVAAGEDLEAAFRAVRILQVMVLSDQSDIEFPALAILEQLAAREASSTKDLASDALEMHRVARQARTIARLRRLGAEVGIAGTEFSGTEVTLTGNEFIAVIIANSKWRGTPADFALLKQVPNLYHVNIYGVRVDDEMAGVLASLNRPSLISLFGTGISDSAYAMLVEKFPPPETKIDRRGTAFLGVMGTIEFNVCEIKEVKPGTPAERAGLLAGDRILSCDGQALQDFPELTRIIATKQAGESVTLQIERGGQEIAKKVTFGEWK